MDENEDEHQEGGDERGEGVIEAVAELGLFAGKEVAEQEDGDQPHNEEEDNHEDDLDLTHAGTEAAGGDGG